MRHFVVVSIFVNPIQFDRADDYDRYPRTLPNGLGLLRKLAAPTSSSRPDAGDVSRGRSDALSMSRSLTERLCGAVSPRPLPRRRHRGGEAVQYRAAGQSLFRREGRAATRHDPADGGGPQFAGATSSASPTVREADGLALSSRNRRLSPDERGIAPTLYQALRVARERIAEGEAIRRRRGASPGRARRGSRASASSISRSSIRRNCSRSPDSRARCWWPRPCGWVRRG